jgi:plasmid stabilization system protein ParE
MRRILWTEPALADPEAIRDYIARDSDGYAAAAVESILAAVERVAVFPQTGRVVPEWHRASVREVFVGSYRVIYRLRRQRVEVLTVIHGAQRVPKRRTP